MTVFDVFEEVPYTYLKLSRGTVLGSTIEGRVERTGVFKLRAGMTSSQNREAYSANATLHVHPEDVDPDGELVGNGVRVEGVDYEIVGVTEGRNFDSGVVEHYTLTLERGDLVS